MEGCRSRDANANGHSGTACCAVLAGPTIPARDADELREAPLGMANLVAGVPTTDPVWRFRDHPCAPAREWWDSRTDTSPPVGRRPLEHSGHAHPSHRRRIRCSPSSRGRSRGSLAPVAPTGICSTAAYLVGNRLRYPDGVRDAFKYLEHGKPFAEVDGVASVANFNVRPRGEHGLIGFAAGAAGRSRRGHRGARRRQGLRRHRRSRVQAEGTARPVGGGRRGQGSAVLTALDAGGGAHRSATHRLLPGSVAIRGATSDARGRAFGGFSLPTPPVRLLLVGGPGRASCRGRDCAPAAAEGGGPGVIHLIRRRPTSWRAARGPEPTSGQNENTESASCLIAGEGAPCLDRAGFGRREVSRCEEHRTPPRAPHCCWYS